MGQNNLYHQLRLSFLPGIGPGLGRKLLSHFGTAEAIFKASGTDLLEVHGISYERIKAILHHHPKERIEKEIRFIEKHKVQVRFFNDPDYPFRLKFCPDAPLLLFGLGNIDWNADRSLSMVGTRKITPYGKKCIQQCLEELSPSECQIISGLAYGVDIYSHRRALKEGLSTVAIVAHGLDKVYPAQHRKTLQEMLQKGGVISEYPSGTQPEREHFPMRNRIIAGMGEATLVVESAIRGGSIITAEIASSYNRDVFAFPGSVDQAMSKGCNRLIRLQKATLVNGGMEIAMSMNWQDKKFALGRQTQLFHDLTPQEEALLSYLHQEGPSSVDLLLQKLEINMSDLAMLLLDLECKMLIQSLPGKVYAPL